MAIPITHTPPRKFARFSKSWRLMTLRWTRVNLFSVITVTLLFGFTAHTLARAQTSSPTGTPTSTPISTPAQAAYLGAVTNATANGAYVLDVVSGSPAQSAGLQAGDLIQSINGEAVTMTTSLGEILKGLAPGANALFIVARGNGWLPIRVTLGA